nr:TrkA family potassium uptake protein [uncultured Anaerostipes sp.]
MFGKQKKEATTYGVIGLGRFGFALTEELAESGAEIMVLDRDEDKIRKIRELTENALVVNSLDKEVLLDTGIQNCDVVIVCIGTHMESSILTTLNLVGMGIPRVISKATSPEHGEILKRLGAEVVYPEQDMAIRLANCLESSGVIDFIKLSEKINISKLTVPEALLGKSVQEVDFRARFGLNIIAIENNNEVMEYVNPDYVFREEDVLIISGSSEGIIKLTEWQK